jgi:2-polyprenyl-6-methoxyphenol hydroxylase-like FAD-dependent oxidoreductase
MPLTPIVAHRRTENRWRRYDEVADWPDGLIAAGDSVCCFDPVYGQGMTTGILGALLIQRRFDAEWKGQLAPPRGFARRVQRHLAQVIRPAWNLATSEDLRLETTTGGHLRTRDRLLQAYFDRVVAAATADSRVRRRLLSVMNMMTGPQTLLHPAVLLGVARHACGLTARRPALWPEWPKAEGIAVDPEARATA